MKRIIVSEFVTLDGVMEAPEKWYPPFWSKESQQFKDEEQFTSSALLLGRKTYEVFAETWPSRTGELADSINRVPKLVVSSTLKKLTWHNSTLIQKNMVEEVSKLKLQSGKDILVVGSGELVRTLLQHHLVDELRLILSPIVLGKGMRLFGESENPKKLNLVETKTFNSNVVLLIYQPDRR